MRMEPQVRCTSVAPQRHPQSEVGWSLGEDHVGEAWHDIHITLRGPLSHDDEDHVGGEWNNIHHLTEPTSHDFSPDVFFLYRSTCR